MVGHKFQISQTPNGRPRSITMNGERLRGIRAYQINNVVDDLPTITLTFIGTVEIVSVPDEA